jgi:Ca2+-transporting ATPase
VRIRDAQAIGFGILGAVLLQVIFSQWSIMNTLFYTTPLTATQWLICLAVGLPMLLVAAGVNRFDPLD